MEFEAWSARARMSWAEARERGFSWAAAEAAREGFGDVDVATDVADASSQGDGVGAVSTTENIVVTIVSASDLGAQSWFWVDAYVRVEHLGYVSSPESFFSITRSF